MSDPHEWHKRAQWAEASYPCLRCMSEALIDAKQALAAAQQAQRDAEKWANDANQVSLRYERQRDEERARAIAAEAELQRAREALEHAGDGHPDVLAYIGDDGAQCVFCGAFGGNPYNVVDVVADWPHEADCVLVAALEAAQPRETPE